MPIYEWICPECEIWWDKEYKMGKAPDRTRCPKCKKLSSRYWQNNIPAVHFNVIGFPDRDRKLAKTGGHVSGDSDEVCKELIQDSKNAIEHGNAMYQKVTFNPEGYNAEAAKLSGEDREKAGYFKPISDDKREDKARRAKKQTADHYNKHMSDKKTGPNDPRIKIQ